MTASKLFIYAEPTPNPATLKFMVGKEIATKTHDFTELAQAKAKSPLAEKIFQIADVTGVYVGRTFLTVSKSGLKHWDDYEDQIISLIEEHLTASLPVITESADTSAPKADLSEIEKKIVAILEDEIRPAVAMDGGDVLFKSYEDGIVYLQMIGSCAGCPSSTATLKMGIETRIREVIPEVTEVVSV